MSLGGNIRKLRIDKKISLESFAAQLGLSSDACAAIENDKRSLSSVEIQRICQILDVTFDSLVSEKKSPKESTVTEESVLIPVDKLQQLLVEMKE